MAGSLDIGTLQGGVEFEDKVSTTLDIVLGKVEKLEASFGGLDHGVRDAAAGFAIAEVAMKAVSAAFDLGLQLVKDFTTEGAAIADVADNFNNVTEAAGRSAATLLGALREGTHATIDDFTLMKLANQDLAAGLNLTDAQFKEMADGAFALSQATGEELAVSLEKVNEALLKGQARGIQTLTGVLDLTAAEEARAAALGTTVERLTEDEKLEARRMAILDGVSAATARLGEQTDGLDEKLAQIGTAWTNFYNNLISGVAASPKVIQAFDDIQTAVVEAFGFDTTSLVDTFVGGVEYLAETVADYAPTVIGWFQSARDAAFRFYGGVMDAWEQYGPGIIGALTTARDWILNVYDAIVETYNALPDWMKEVAEKSALTAAGLYALDAAGGAVGLSLGDVISGVSGVATTLADLPGGIRKVVEGFMELGALKAVLDFSSLADARASVTLLAEGIYGAVGPLGIAVAYATALYAAFELGKWEPISDFFFELGLEIQGFTQAEQDAIMAQEKATKAAVEAAAATEKQVDSSVDLEKVQRDIEAALAGVNIKTNENTAALGTNTDTVRRSKEEIQKYKEAWDSINAVGTSLQSTIDQIDGVVVESIKHYLDAGVSMDKLKVAYELTDEQANALKETFTAQNKALEDQKKAATDIAKAWNNLNQIGEDQEKIIRGIGDRVKSDIGHYADMGASVRDLAKAYGLTEIQIKAIIDTREKERQATDAQTESYKRQNEELDATQIKVQNLHGDYVSLAEAKALQSQGGSFEINRGNLDESARQWNIPMTVADTMAQKGASFQEILAAWQSGDWQSWVPHGPRIPGYREGGVGDFGDGTLAMLHGKEAIIPESKWGGLGNVINNMYINGTAEDVANQIADVLMRQLKSVRQFGAA